MPEGNVARNFASARVDLEPVAVLDPGGSSDDGGRVACCQRDEQPLSSSTPFRAAGRKWRKVDNQPKRGP